jgi:adenosylhomocysteine nucleosidase
MTIAILSALPEEQAGMLGLLDKPECIQRAGREFWCGTVHKRPVVLALSRVGKVAAATTATTLIEHFGAHSIVFTGVAGGLAPHVQVGDLVIGTQYVQHDMDATPLFARYEVPLYGRSHFEADKKLTATVLEAARAQFLLVSASKELNIHQGLIAGLLHPQRSRGASTARRATRRAMRRNGGRCRGAGVL